MVLLAACSTPAAAEWPDPAPSTAAAPTAVAATPARLTDRGLRDCAVQPSRCGYPDQTNTGVPVGTYLRPSESVVASEDGQVIDGLDITGEISVEADNVIIRNTRVTGGRDVGNADWVIIMRPGAENLRIEDSELMTPAGSAQDIACLLNIGNGQPTLVRVDIHGCSAGVSSGGGLVVDSYVHDMAEVPGQSHDVGIASNGGGGMTILHNTVINQLGQTAAIAFYQDFSPQADNLVQDNLLAGGGYCLYGGTGARGPTRDIRFLDNRLSKSVFAACGSYGVLASFAEQDPGNAFTGNYWDESGDDVSAS